MPMLRRTFLGEQKNEWNKKGALLIEHVRFGDVVYWMIIQIVYSKLKTATIPVTVTCVFGVHRFVAPFQQPIPIERRQPRPDGVLDKTNVPINRSVLINGKINMPSSLCNNHKPAKYTRSIVAITIVPQR